MFTPGQSVQWLYEPRGGYGYRYWVDAVVVKVTEKRITLEAKLASGGTKQVSVKPEKVRVKEQPNV